MDKMENSSGKAETLLFALPKKTIVLFLKILFIPSYRRTAESIRRVV